MFLKGLRYKTYLLVKLVIVLFGIICQNSNLVGTKLKPNIKIEGLWKKTRQTAGMKFTQRK